MASNFSPEAADFYNCGVCLKHMEHRKPRFLACHHSFCESCLRDLIKQNRIICPTCRHPTHVNKGDVSKLAPKSLLLRFIDQEKKQGDQQRKKVKLEPQSSDSIPKCAICNQASASGACNVCQDLLCKECVNKHNKVEKYQEHSILPLTRVCQDHGKVVLQICQDCYVAVCSACIVLEHAEHIIEDYDKYVTENTREIGSRLKCGLSNIRRWKREDRWETSETTDLERGIKKKYDYFMGKAQEAKDVLTKIENDYKSKLDIVIENYENIEHNLTQMLQTVEDTYENSSSVKTLKDTKHDIQQKLDKLENKIIKRYELPPFQVSDSRSKLSITMGRSVPFKERIFMTFNPKDQLESDYNKCDATFKMAVNCKPFMTIWCSKMYSSPPCMVRNLPWYGDILSCKATGDIGIISMEQNKEHIYKEFDETFTRENNQIVLEHFISIQDLQKYCILDGTALFEVYIRADRPKKIQSN